MSQLCKLIFLPLFSTARTLSLLNSSYFFLPLGLLPLLCLYSTSNSNPKRCCICSFVKSVFIYVCLCSSPLQAFSCFPWDCFHSNWRISFSFSFCAGLVHWWQVPLVFVWEYVYFDSALKDMFTWNRILGER